MKARMLILLFAIIANIGIVYSEKVLVGELYYNLDATNRTAEVTYDNFYANYNLVTITIPNAINRSNLTYHVTSIGERAFENCNSLTSVTIPNSVTSIGEWAFDGCSNLSFVHLSDSITSIGGHAFQSCHSLISITIPNSVTSFGNDAFLQCTNLTSVVWNARNYPNISSDYLSPFYIIRDNITSFVFGDSVRTIPAYLCCGMSNLNSIAIPSSVTSIEKFTFADCSSLSYISIPNGVTSIGQAAFSGCSSLSAVIIPNSVTSIGKAAFSYCSSLTTITIPNSVKSIEKSTFSGCSGLSSVVIPNSVTSIGERAFFNCSSLSFISIGDNVASIVNDAFRGCSGLTSIVWNVRNYPDTSNDNSSPFYYNIRENITSFVFGDSVQTIPAYLCSGMSNLSSITIPFSITSIGSSAFSDCSKLASVIAKREITVPSLGLDVWSNDSATLYVICGASTKYASSNWGTYFSNIEEFVPYQINVVSADTTMGNVWVESVTCNDTTIHVTAMPKEGFLFSAWDDGVTDAERYISLTQDINLVATFQPQSFIIMFLNSDSTLLQLDTLAYGAIPEYRGEDPVKPMEDETFFVFTGWEPSIVAVTGNATYIATYESHGTGVAIPNETKQPLKIWNNGQLYILLPSGHVFDSTGKKVE